MSVGEDEKQISVRVDAELVDEVDRAILESKANQNLTMDFTRSDAVRDFLERVADDPAVLYEDSDEDEKGQEMAA